MTDELHVEMAPAEVARLSELLVELINLLRDGRESEDPAIARLTPSPYPDDADAAEEFAAGTRHELLDRRLVDAETAKSVLAPALSGLDQLSDEQAFAERPLSIGLSEVEAVLRALNTLRLVIATRLDISDDEDHDPDDRRFAIYDWLGYRLELLVQAADQVDG